MSAWTYRFDVRHAHETWPTQFWKRYRYFRAQTMGLFDSLYSAL
jgi:hypothetical protein